MFILNINIKNSKYMNGMFKVNLYIIHKINIFAINSTKSDFIEYLFH